MTRTAIQMAELKEQERHNKEQERIGKIGNIIGAVGTVSSIAGAAGNILKGAGSLAKAKQGVTRTVMSNAKPGNTYIANRNTNYNFGSRSNGYRR